MCVCVSARLQAVRQLEALRKEAVKVVSSGNMSDDGVHSFDKVRNEVVTMKRNGLAGTESK